MKPHLDDTDLIALCEADPNASGPADDAGLEDLRAHLLACPPCARRFSGLRELVRAAREWSLVEAPDSWVESAMARVRELLDDGTHAGAVTPSNDPPKAGQANAGERIRRAARNFVDQVETVWARIVLDSASSAPLPGIRGGTTLLPRQLMYESTLGTIHLQIESKKPRHLEIVGQFLPVAGALGSDPERVVLEDGTHRVSRKLQASGEFHFRSVRPGPVRLRFEMGSKVVELEPLQLGTDDD